MLTNGLSDDILLQRRNCESRIFFFSAAEVIAAAAAEAALLHAAQTNKYLAANSLSNKAAFHKKTTTAADLVQTTEFRGCCWGWWPKFPFSSPNCEFRAKRIFLRLFYVLFFASAAAEFSFGGSGKVFLTATTSCRKEPIWAWKMKVDFINWLFKFFSSIRIRDNRQKKIIISSVFLWCSFQNTICKSGNYESEVEREFLM